MFSGIIYLRISPSNKGYVGQTIDEAGRDWEFGNLNKRYGGAAIEAARRKYPPSLWRKFTICTVNARNRDELRVWLVAIPVYLIAYGALFAGLGLLVGLGRLFLWLGDRLDRLGRA